VHITPYLTTCIVIVNLFTFNKILQTKITGIAYILHDQTLFIQFWLIFVMRNCNLLSGVNVLFVSPIGAPPPSLKDRYCEEWYLLRCYVVWLL
jgi:hypothetical protein